MIFRIRVGKGICLVLFFMGQNHAALGNEYNLGVRDSHALTSNPYRENDKASTQRRGEWYRDGFAQGYDAGFNSGNTASSNKTDERIKELETEMDKLYELMVELLADSF